MEAPEGKPVDRKNVTIMIVEPPPESAERGGIGQFEGSAIAQPQTNGVRSVGGDAFADRQRIFPERSKGFRPGFSPMDVCAISEMQAVIQFHNPIEQHKREGGKEEPGVRKNDFWISQDRDICYIGESKSIYARGSAAIAAF